MTNNVTPYNPFARQGLAESAHAGAVSIESERAVAEAQGSLVLAKRFPRDQAACYQRAIDACKRPGLANSAFYSFKRGKETISGPTIRLAEELARCWGNIDFGTKELSRKAGFAGAAGESEMMAFAWDKETNTMSSQSFTVRHTRDTQQGGYQLTSERDIYEKTANEGARRLRARILAILPPDLIEGAIEECKRTLAGGNGEPLSDRINKMVAAFGKYGVTTDMMIAHLGHPLDKTTPAELAELLGVYNSIKDGHQTVADWFSKPEAANENTAAAIANINAAASAAPEATTQQERKPAAARRTPAKEKPATEPKPDPKPELEPVAEAEPEIEAAPPRDPEEEAAAAAAYAQTAAQTPSDDF